VFNTVTFLNVSPKQVWPTGTSVKNYEVSFEVSVEREPEKFSKFRVKKCFCVSLKSICGAQHKICAVKLISTQILSGLWFNETILCCRKTKVLLNQRDFNNKVISNKIGLRDKAEVCTGVSTGRGALDFFAGFLNAQ
jgi:hypothetical protein